MKKQQSKMNIGVGIASGYTLLNVVRKVAQIPWTDVGAALQVAAVAGVHVGKYLFV